MAFLFDKTGYYAMISMRVGEKTMAEIIISSDYKKVNITDELVEKIKYIVKRNVILRGYYNDVSTDIPYSTFNEIVTDFVHDCNMGLKVYEDIEFNENLIEEYKELLPKNNEYNMVSYYLNNKKIPDLVKVIDNIYQIDKSIEKYFLTRDLITAKDDTIINMKYFMSEEDISLFDRAYTVASLNKDTVTMKKILENVQEKILVEWANYFGNLDTMTDDNFCFLGHSSKTIEYNNKFKTRYVSCSLYNQDVNDAFNNDFGFIMAPSNIVGASSSDMYADNEAIDAGDLLNYSSIRKIDHPQRLIDECLILKNENIANDKITPVYSEVIQDGFSPIAIFGFTNGAKSYDYNYRSAYELQKSFPSLKVYIFDVMKCKKGRELESFKLELVDSLLEKIVSYGDSCDSNDLFRYDYFFEEFDKLKKKGNYTENDIEIIFRKNLDMLSPLENSTDKLFNGDYSFDEIKYILGKNYNYNIDFILKGNITPFAINKLDSLLPYKDKLNDYYDGLAELVEIVSKVEVTSSMIKEIKNDGLTNLYTISKYLTRKYITILNDREERKKFELQKARIAKEELLKEKLCREEMEKEYLFYSGIKIFESFSKPIKEDYKRVVDAITNNDNELNMLLAKQSELEKQLNNLVALKEQEKTTSYHNPKITSTLANITKELELLSTHPILNFGKIGKINQQIRRLTEERTNEEQNYKKKQKEKINCVDSSINTIETKINLNKDKIEVVKIRKDELNKEKQMIISKINQYFKCDSIDKIDIMIEKSKEVKDKYDILNSVVLKQINNKLGEIDKKIIGNEKGLDRINEERKSARINL